MTLCIAATCTHEGEELIILCSDLEVGSWAAKAEIGFKLKWACFNWPAMISGEMSRATELVNTFKDHLKDRVLDRHNVYDAMKEAGNIFRKKLADEIVERNLSVPYEYLKKNRGQFPAAKVLETYSQIGKIDSQAELIVAGFIGPRPHMFIVESDCTVTYRDNFACIGTGAYVAEPALYQRRQNHSLNLARTLYHTYEAKRLGQIAEGVGEHTVMVGIGPPGAAELGIKMFHLKDAHHDFLEESYGVYGLKSTAEFKWPEEQKFE